MIEILNHEKIKLNNELQLYQQNYITITEHDKQLLLLQNNIKNIEDNHTQNILQLKKQIQIHGEFLLLNRNFFANKNEGIDRLPYIDTRVFCLNKKTLKLLLEDCYESIEEKNIKFEHAALSSVLRIPELSRCVFTHGVFYPIMSGLSGHGRNYSSCFSKLRSIMKSIFYKFGV